MPGIVTLWSDCQEIISSFKIDISQSKRDGDFLPTSKELKIMALGLVGLAWCPFLACPSGVLENGGGA